jgi:hypothetical protein
VGKLSQRVSRPNYIRKPADATRHRGKGEYNMFIKTNNLELVNELDQEIKKALQEALEEAEQDIPEWSDSEAHELVDPVEVITPIVQKYDLELLTDYDTNVAWDTPGIVIYCNIETAYLGEPDDDFDMEESDSESDLEPDEEHEPEPESEHDEEDESVDLDGVAVYDGTYVDAFKHEAREEWAKYCKPLYNHYDHPFDIYKEPESVEINFTDSAYLKEFPEWKEAFTNKGNV